MSRARGRSASGSAAVSSRSSPIRPLASPSARSASIRSSTAVDRSSSSRAAGAAAKSSSATSASAGPRQAASASRSRRTAAGASPAAQGAAARAGGPLEGHGVHRLRRHRQPVARRGGLEHAVVDSRLAERGAQPGDQGLQGVGSVRGALVGPEPLDQLVRRHHAARVEGKQDQQRAHPVAADPHRAARRRRVPGACRARRYARLCRHAPSRRSVPVSPNAIDLDSPRMRPLP